jgi:methionyl-tRNA formyltransferase
VIPPAPRKPQRLVYLGTPDAAVPPLRALADAGHEIALVVTRPDKRRGRGGDPSPSPVKQAALDLGLPVSHELTDVLGVGADLGVVVAYGRIIPTTVLEQLPMVNLHFSTLPRWRGAAPVERAVLAGDHATGVCLMAVAEGLDTGDVYEWAEVAIDPDETADELRARLVTVGTELLIESLADGLEQPVPQEGEATYAEKLTNAELEIDWSRPADEVHRLVRVGGAFTQVRGRRLKVWRIAPRADLAPAPAAVISGTVVGTGSQPVELLEVQPEGKRRMAAADWARGSAIESGERLGAAR